MRIGRDVREGIEPDLQRASRGCVRRLASQRKSIGALDTRAPVGRPACVSPGENSARARAEARNARFECTNGKQAGLPRGSEQAYKPGLTNGWRAAADRPS